MLTTFCYRYSLIPFVFSPLPPNLTQIPKGMDPVLGHSTTEKALGKHPVHVRATENEDADPRLCELLHFNPTIFPGKKSHPFHQLLPRKCRHFRPPGLTQKRRKPSPWEHPTVRKPSTYQKRIRKILATRSTRHT